MWGMRKGPRSMLAGVIAVVWASGCATHSFETSAPAPGVPRISNLRIEPAEVENGGQVTLRFDFVDLGADIMDVYLGVSAEVKDFTLATGLRSAVISQGRYFGQRKGTAQETLKVTIEPPPLPLAQRDFDGGVGSPHIRERDRSGIRVYKVFVVDQAGQVSNALRARVTIRPSLAALVRIPGPHRASIPYSTGICESCSGPRIDAEEFRSPGQVACRLHAWRRLVEIAAYVCDKCGFEAETS